MPDEKKSNRKNDPKEQRRSRRRHDVQADKQENKHPRSVNKEPEAPKGQAIPVTEKPTYEPPGPEFYKNLKRETDEIIKITEEANSKYKKKEIQSNWSKYEISIDSYNEIEEQENMGADYEALIEASFSVGGHFQFKHEKSWDISTAPSLYDKYFEIDMDKLAIALSTIPFYERNSIDQSTFSETDILNMNNRATKFKQKYYNDKKFTTPELQAQEKILNKLTNSNENNDKESTMISEEEGEKNNDATKVVDFTNDVETNFEIVTDIVAVEENSSSAKGEDTFTKEIETELETINYNENNLSESKKLDTKLEETQLDKIKQKHVVNKFANEIDDIINIVESKKDEKEMTAEPKMSIQNIEPMQKAIEVPHAVSPVKEKVPTKNPVIESPEDLEKWLDDFLDS